MNAKADRNLKVKMLALVLVFTLSILSPLGTMTSEAATFVSATISVNPDRGLVGTTVTVNGSGFTGGFPAAIFWDKVQMVTFTMPKGGSFSMSFKVPAQASPGGHTISVCSNCGGGEFEERAATGFKVTEPPVVPPNPSPTKEPPPTNPTTPPSPPEPLPVAGPVGQDENSKFTPQNSDVYTVYEFVSEGNLASVDRTSWKGNLFLLNPKEVSNIVAVITVSEFGRFGGDLWYQNHDGSLSKIIMNAKNQELGVFTITADGTIAASLDLDVDGIVDIMDIIIANEREIVIVKEGGVRDYLSDILNGFDPLCDEAEDLKSQTSNDELLGVITCGGEKSAEQQGINSGESSPLGGGSRETTGNDPDDIICEGRDVHPGRVGGLPKFFADDLMERACTGTCTVVLALIGMEKGGLPGALVGGVAGAMGCPDACRSPYQIRHLPPPESNNNSPNNTEQNEANRYHDTNGDGVNDAEDTNGDGIPDASCNPCGGSENSDSGGDGDSTPSQPGGDPDPERNANHDAAIDELCARIQSGGNDHDITSAERTTVETDCQDPVVNPDTAAQEGSGDMGNIECSEEPERNYEADLDALLGGRSGGNCGITEQPGPDGTCAGSFGFSSGGGGNAWVALGTILGIEDPCEADGCDETW